MLTPVIKVGGSDLPVRWLDGLVHARVDRGLGLVGRCVLRFLDHGFGLSASGTFAIGKEVSVSVSGGGSPLLSGTVTAVELEQVGTTSTPELIVTVDDLAARLASTTRSRTFLNQSVERVVASVCSGAGLSATVSGGSTEHPYLLQTGTDLAFLTSLLGRSGLVWWLEGKSLQAVPAGTSTASVSLELGVHVTAFSVRATASAPDTVSVTGWDQGQQTSIAAEVATKSKAPVSSSPAFVAGAAGRSNPAKRGWSSAIVVADPPPLNSKEAGQFAGAMAAEVAAAAVTMSATCVVDARLKPSVKVQIKDAGPAGGDYLLTHVEHVYSRAGFQSRITAGPVRPAGIVGLLAAPPPDPGYAMHGLVPAIVTNADNKDKVGQGLVKVKYPSISGNVESTWARVLSLGAGKERGIVFQPEVGDEVLVAFERGDTRRAVVLGGLYSEKTTLPDTDHVSNDKVTFRRITSRKGHVLEFRDGDGDDEQHVLLSAKGGAHKIQLGNDKLVIEVGNVPVSITNGAGASIDFADNGDVTIKGKNVTIESTAGKTSVKSATDLELKATAGLKAEGATAGLTGKAAVKVEASGQLALKGAMVAIN